MPAKKQNSKPDDYPNDTHMLNFVGIYVTEISEVEQKKGATLVQVEYYPKHETMMLASCKGKNRLQCFRHCLKEAIRVTDAIFGNRDWDVLGTPVNRRK